MGREDHVKAFEDNSLIDAFDDDEIYMEEVDSIDYRAVVAYLCGQELTPAQQAEVKRWNDLYEEDFERKSKAGALYVQRAGLV